MPYSSSLTDKEWILIELLLPKKKENLSYKMEQKTNIGRCTLSIEEWL